MGYKYKDDYTLAMDRNELDIPYIHKYLCEDSYWAKGIDYDTVEKSIRNSLCVGLFYKRSQIGFARVITDYATFGYLADVFVDERHRGKGLSKWMLTEIMALPDFQRLRRIMLATDDAHGLYKKFGFEVYDNNDKKLMGIRRKAEEMYNRG
ncbi:GNAT family N-acetyltransferase [Pseudalkalibacillus salsuginis]|uniref:GNAT family N-acetyltransferase n=1 Tax=Pseudalkalibacillus salsuginis TaxID=2910972 RepID=UPI001F31990A|nr:GNAT family N-acetyltransferase [Pseudalkalibacillus salsuginis]MCF6408854.1 GNAT family N-acetyltransferase [Pseudalkalibacillus salsuginis]